MKLRLLSVLVAATALGGCASYDYAGGGAGGYYHGRPSADDYAGYAGYGGYDRYGYGGYAPYGYYGYGGRDYRYYRYGGGYNPYYPYPRYYVVRPPHDDHDNDHPNHRDHHGDDDQDDDPRGERPPPWRAPDGRYRDTGSVMVPPRNRALPQSSIPRRVLADPSRPMTAPPSMAVPRSSPPPPQRAVRAAQSERPAPRVRQESGVRDEEN